MKAYQLDFNQIESDFNTNIKNGLSIDDLNENKAEKASVKSLLPGVWDELKNKVNYIHILALVCFFVAICFCILNRDWIYFFYLLASVFVIFVLFVFESAALGRLKYKYFQHIKACDQSILVLRNAKEQWISLGEMQIGDVLLLNEGTILHGDARIVEAHSLFADERVVFGKTIPTSKIADIMSEENILPENQSNMLWKGSYIASGSGRAIIVALDQDCYVEKTGGRKTRKQRSFVYNRQSNIGKVASLAFAILSFFLLFVGAIISGRWVDSLVMVGAMLSLISLEPVSCITEWNYYSFAQKLYKQGALVRNIEAFDGISKEKEVVFTVDALLEGNLRFHDHLVLQGDHHINAGYFSMLCKSGIKFAPSFDFDEDLNDLSLFQTEKDSSGNNYGSFSTDDGSLTVAAGYWRKILSKVGAVDDELIQWAEESERHGKVLYFLGRKMQEEHSSFALQSIFIYDILMDERVYKMSTRLQKSGILVHLLSGHSELLSQYIKKQYDMGEILPEPPQKPLYSLPLFNPSVAYEDDSMVIKERASLILSKDVMPQKIVYDIRCMFCGIERCLNFIFVNSLFLLITVFVLLLRQEPIYSILLPLLFLQPILVCVCNFLAKSVRNCGQSKLSIIMGFLFGVIPFIGALVGSDMAMMISSISAVLYATFLWIGTLKYKSITYTDFMPLIFALILAIFPWIFLGGNWLVAFLFAIFPVGTALIIEYIY